MMRRLFLISAALLCASLLSANGQTSSKYVPDYRWEARAGWGLVPYVNVILYGITSLSHVSEDKKDNEHKDEGVATGDISLEASYKLNRWLSVGADLSWQGFNSKLGGETASHSLDIITVMPNVTANYLTRKNCTLYAKAEIGAAYYNYDCTDNNNLIFAFQVSPIGVTFGHKFYGFAELSAGLLYQGGKLGVGYRF